MKNQIFDVVIIGAGTAGLNARKAAEKAGASVLLIDAAPLGTTCARIGCMPSKLLIAASERAFHAKEASRFGIRTTVDVQGRKVMQRVQKERDYFVDTVLKTIRELESKKRFIRGKARFLDARTLEAGKHRVKAKTFVIATGASPVIPGPYRHLSPYLFTNENIFEIKKLPQSLLVVGTGLIGLELGQAFHRLGVRTTLLGMENTVGPLKDPHVLAEAGKIFSAELDFYPSHRLNEVKKLRNRFRIAFTDLQGQKHRANFEKILVAAGRKPNLQGLDLPKTGIVSDQETIIRTDPHTLQIGKSNIFLAGDVTGQLPLLHEASDEGKIAGANAAHYPHVKRQTRRTELKIVFTDPQIAIVGKNSEQCDRKKTEIGDVDYGAQGRARVMGMNKGLVRIYGNKKDGRILGAEMLGPRVEHTAHLLAWSIESKMTVADLLKMPFFHPVIEEGIHTALKNLQSALQKSRRDSNSCEDTGPGA